MWRRTEAGLLAAQADGHRLAVLDMPLLLEIGWQLRSEAVWVVKVPEEEQIRRVCARDGATREEALARIRKQMPTGNKLNYADVVIDNSRTISATEAQVRAALAAVPGGGALKSKGRVYEKRLAEKRAHAREGEAGARVFAVLLALLCAFRLAGVHELIPITWLHRPPDGVQHLIDANAERFPWIKICCRPSF